TAGRLAARAGAVTEARAATSATYVHLWRGDLADARRLLERHSPALAAAHDWRLHELWGLLLEAEGSLGEARSHFQQAAEEDPIPIRDLASIARTSVALGDLPTAG